MALVWHFISLFAVAIETGLAEKDELCVFLYFCSFSLKFSLKCCGESRVLRFYSGCAFKGSLFCSFDLFYLTALW